MEREACRRTAFDRIRVVTDDTVFELDSLEQLVLDVVELARETQSEGANDRMRALVLRICREPELYLPVVKSPGAERDPEPSTIPAPLALAGQPA